MSVRVFACMGRYEAHVPTIRSHDTIQNTEFNRDSYWVPGRASYKMSMMQTEFQQRIVLVFQKEHPINTNVVQPRPRLQGEHHTTMQYMLQGEHHTLMQHVLQGELEEACDCGRFIDTIYS